MKTVSEISEREKTIEQRKAAMRKKRRKLRVKKRLIVFLFIFLCAAVILTVLKAPFFNVAKIECTGQQTLSYEQILTTAQLKTGSNIFTINIESVKRRLTAIPAVAEVTVRRVFPNKISIWIRESDEAAYINVNGMMAVIDSSGKIIRTAPADDEQTKASMAEVLGVAAVTDKPGELISAEGDIVAQQAYGCIKILNELGLLKKVNRIDLTDMSDFKLKYDNRLEIYLGGYEKMEYKLRFIGKVIAENISEYEKAKLDYRGDRLYVGALTEEIVQEEFEEKSSEDADETVEKQSENQEDVNEKTNTEQNGQ